MERERGGRIRTLSNANTFDLDNVVKRSVITFKPGQRYFTHLVEFLDDFVKQLKCRNNILHYVSTGVPYRYK